jgi:hypothetical protein
MAQAATVVVPVPAPPRKSSKARAKADAAEDDALFGPCPIHPSLYLCMYLLVCV